MKDLIRLYPRTWRARYGDELATLLSAERPTIRLALDLIAGAIDARLNPQRPLGKPAGGADRKEPTMGRPYFCQPSDVGAAEYRKSMIGMLGGTLLLSAIYIALKRTTGDNPIVDAFGISAFPIALLLSGRTTYFKPYSPRARAVIIGASIVAVFLISLFACIIASRI